jgi:hypothetical protein
MLRRGDINGRQVCPGAPWVIKTVDLTGFAGRKRSDPPLTPNPDQRAFGSGCNEVMTLMAMSAGLFVEAVVLSGIGSSPCDPSSGLHHIISGSGSGS